MRRILVLTVVWLAATTAAVAVAWAGVRVVSASVVDPLPPRALAAVAGAASGAATSPPPIASPMPSPVDGPSADAPTASDPPPEQTPVPRATPGANATRASDPPQPRTATDPPPAGSNSEPVAEGELRSYQVVGGSVTLRFSPGRVTIVTAVPRNDHFDLRLEGNNTAEATVRFESDEHRSRVRGWWEDGPRDRVEEDEHSEDH